MIGKRGDNLRYMTQQFGIKVQHDKTTPPTSAVEIFRLQGTDEMVKETVNYLQEKLRLVQPKK